MEKKYYNRPITEMVVVKGVLMGTVNYYGKVVSNGFNPTNQGGFDEGEAEQDNTDYFPTSPCLWDAED